MRLKEEFKLVEGDNTIGNSKVKVAKSETSRRKFGHMALASAVGAALVACGGGSDPTGVTDDASTNEPNLRKAYDRIVQGKKRDEVISIVGVSPNDYDSQSGSGWYYDSASLQVSYFGEINSKGRTVSYVVYDPANGVAISKEFDE